MSDNIVESKDVIVEKKKKGWFKCNWYKLIILLLLVIFDVFAILGCAIRNEYKNLKPNITVPVVNQRIKKLNDSDILIADDFTEGFSDDSLIHCTNIDIISYNDYFNLSDNDKANVVLYYRWSRDFNSTLNLYDYTDR